MPLRVLMEHVFSVEVLAGHPPVAGYRGFYVASSAHYLAGGVSGPELEAGTLWQRTEHS